MLLSLRMQTTDDANLYYKHKPLQNLWKSLKQLYLLGDKICLNHNHYSLQFESEPIRRRPLAETGDCATTTGLCGREITRGHQYHQIRRQRFRQGKTEVLQWQGQWPAITVSTWMFVSSTEACHGIWNVMEFWNGLWQVWKKSCINFEKVTTN